MNGDKDTVAKAAGAVTAVGTPGAIIAAVTAGSGLSGGAAIMSGLATAGVLVSGGALAGIAVVGGASVLTGYGAYRGMKAIRNRIAGRKDDSHHDGNQPDLL